MVGGALEELEETGNIIINLRLDRKHEPLCSVPSPGLQMAQALDAAWALGERERNRLSSAKSAKRGQQMHHFSSVFSIDVGKSSLSTMLYGLNKEFHLYLTLAYYRCCYLVLVMFSGEQNLSCSIDFLSVFAPIHA